MSPKKPLVPQSAWGRLVEAAPEEGVQPLKNAKRIETRLIYPDPRQPRKRFDAGPMEELIKSIEQRGILQPITVQADGAGRYLIITGERRFRAAQALDLETVPAIVVDLTEPEMRLDRVIENRQRQDLSDMEFADALEEIKEDLGARAPNLTSNELDEHVGERLGISGRTVRSFIALNHLPHDIKELLGSLRTELRTRGLARLRDMPDRQRALAQAVVDHDLSGRQTVAAAQLLKKNRALPIDEAVALVLGTAEAAPASAPAARPNGQLRPMQAALREAISLLRRPGTVGEDAPLTVAELHEIYRLLEPLAGVYIQLAPAIAQYMRAGADEDTGIRLADALAAWEAERASGRGSRRSGVA
jgi:ParB family chromosome partitioning protein